MHPVLQALRELDAEHRCPAPGEWGLSLPDVGGHPLHVGLREDGDLLRVQAEACPAAWAPDPHWLLHRNRLGVLVRFTHSGGGDVWVQAEVPLRGLDAGIVERVLALVVQAAQDARAPR